MKRAKQLLVSVTGTFLFIMMAFSTITRGADTPGFVKNLSAPPLGITASSVILLWDDFPEPDLQRKGASLSMWRYDIYQDDVKIGSARKRTFTAKGLDPERSYTFAVSCNTDNADLTTLDAIQISTKAAGAVFNVRDFGAAGDGKKWIPEPFRNRSMPAARAESY